MKFIRNIVNSPLFRVSSLNAASILVKIAGGLLSSKIIALFIGPSGLALVGNMRNFLTTIDTVSTLGFNNGIIKYVAENEGDKQRFHKILCTVFTVILVMVLLLSSILLIASGYWSTLIIGEGTKYAWVFRVLAFALPWYTANLLFIAILNGLGRYKDVISINIWGNVTGVLLSALLIWKFGIPGALTGLIFTPVLMFLFSFYLIKKQFPGFGFLKAGNFDRTMLKGLFSYSLMSLVTAIMGPVVYLLIRNSLINGYGTDEAGIWEGMNRLATFYLMFIATLLTVYFLPKLSTAKTDAETRNVFWSYYKGIVPVFALGLTVIYFLREFIIKLVLSEEFLPMTELFFWQLLGDLLKVCSLILGYEFFARKMTKAYIVTELMSYLVLYVSSMFLIAAHGSEGAVMAHAFTYLIYLAVLVVYFRKKLF